MDEANAPAKKDETTKGNIVRVDVSLGADEEGMIGRQCPSRECNRYFKVIVSDFNRHSGGELFCPYCGTRRHGSRFVTKEQLLYAESIAVKEALRPMKQRPEMWNSSRAIKIKVQEPEVAHYVERHSRRTVHCEKCQRTYSVYGLSYYCPFCGQRKPLNVYHENINAIRRMLILAESLAKNSNLILDPDIEQLREEGVLDIIVERALDMVVTSFEAYCKFKYSDKMTQLQPSSRQHFLRKVGNSFQNLDKAEQMLKRDLGYDLASRLSPDDRMVIFRGFQKRHVIIHNSGIIDEKYVLATGENYSLIGTRLQIGRTEAEELLATVTRLVENIEKSL